MRERMNMEYYQGRALREREMARTSVNETIAGIHLEMAERYEEIVEQAQKTQAAQPDGR